MKRLIALTRDVPESLAACELTHLTRVPIDVAKARAQHHSYEAALASLGCEVRQLPPAPHLPDSVFVEDAAIVLDELAVVTRPGALSRRGEIDSVAEALASWRQLQFLSGPATLDGGDVLRLGRTLYVGIGSRTNMDGAQRLEKLVRPHGYRVRTVAVRECLHLKSAATELAPGLVLVNPAWIDERAFDGYQTVHVNDGEPFAANVLRVGDRILAAAAYEATNARIRSAGLDLDVVDVSELAKTEGGVTCCSLIFQA